MKRLTFSPIASFELFVCLSACLSHRIASNWMGKKREQSISCLLRWRLPLSSVSLSIEMHNSFVESSAPVFGFVMKKNPLRDEIRHEIPCLFRHRCNGRNENCQTWSVARVHASVWVRSIASSSSSLPARSARLNQQSFAGWQFSTVIHRVHKLYCNPSNQNTNYYNAEEEEGLWCACVCLWCSAEVWE